jgi:hypothetical protein
VSAEAREAGFVAALEGEGAAGVFVGRSETAATAAAGKNASLDARAFRGACAPGGRVGSAPRDVTARFRSRHLSKREVSDGMG